MTFYVDADDQRQKARWAEQRLLEHDALRESTRPTQTRAQWEDDDPVAQALPPVFRRPEGYVTSRDTSVERRAARFRDGLPPPPLPVDPREIPRMLLPAAPPLMDQAAFDQGYPAPVQTSAVAPYPRARADPSGAARVASGEYEAAEYEPRWQMSSAGLVPVGPQPSEAYAQGAPRGGAPVLLPREVVAQIPGLSPSQKKRLRRKKAKQGRTSQGRPAPFPLAVDQQGGATLPVGTNGHAPGETLVLPPPEPSGPTSQTACWAECIVRMPNGSEHRLRCPLTPFPHPNQPHMVRLQASMPGDAEVFIGFWLPGE